MKAAPTPRLRLESLEGREVPTYVPWLDPAHNLQITAQGALTST